MIHTWGRSESQNKLEGLALLEHTFNKGLPMIDKLSFYDWLRLSHCYKKTLSVWQVRLHSPKDLVQRPPQAKFGLIYTRD